MVARGGRGDVSLKQGAVKHRMVLERVQKAETVGEIY